MMGDVGYLDAATGKFNPLFNIFHDSKRQSDSPMVVPDNFIPIQPPFKDWKVKASPDYFPQGAIIASEGVNITRTSEENLYVLFPLKTLLTSS